MVYLHAGSLWHLQLMAWLFLSSRTHRFCLTQPTCLSVFYQFFLTLRHYLTNSVRRGSTNFIFCRERNVFRIQIICQFLLISLRDGPYSPQSAFKLIFLPFFLCNRNIELQSLLGKFETIWGLVRRAANIGWIWICHGSLPACHISHHWRVESLTWLYLLVWILGHGLRLSWRNLAWVNLQSFASNLLLGTLFPCLLVWTLKGGGCVN